MIPTTLNKILVILEEEPPVIWQLVGFALEPPSQEARCVALASLANPSWIATTLACIRPPDPREEVEGKDTVDVNWFLLNFLAALTMQFTEAALAEFRPLIADEERRVFAITALSLISALKVKEQTVPTLLFLLGYEQASYEWNNDEYQSYLYAFLANGRRVALDAIIGLQERLPVSQHWKHECLMQNIEHFRNLVKRENQGPDPQEFQNEVEWALDYLERTGVVNLIAQDA